MSKRLLFLIHSLSMGGAERVAVTLANYWAAKGYTVAVATLSSTSNDFYTLDPSVERIALNTAKPSPNILSALSNNFYTLRAVRHLLKVWQPEITISLMSQANVYLALASWGMSGQKIGSEHIHPPMLPLGRVWELLRHLAYGRLDHLVALTEPSATWLQQHTSVKHLSVIANPISWPLPTHPPLREPIKLLRPERKHLLAVGRLAEQKGFDLLLEAFAQITTTFPEWDLVIVGEGPMRESLQAQLEKNGLQNRVCLVGAVGNMAHWYEACDIYVMSSRFEGFGNTLVEAMAHGLAVVSFDCETGPRDIIRNGVDGLLVPNGDVPALINSLSQLMDNAELRYEFGLKATETREKFSIEKIAEKWEELFKAVKNAT